MNLPNLDDFIASTAAGTPPPQLDPCLLALWHEKRGDWERAHEIVQDIETATASLIHAYLHRREGDEANARYWYSRAGRRFPAGQSLDDEWLELTNELWPSN
ncbi:MAG: hypothetical protein ACK562_16790 [Acidobacteriota bacterium]|jgi:hypothetical protein